MAILIIDRHGRYATGIARVLEAEGYRVQTATTERAVRAMAGRVRFNIIVKSFDTMRSDGLALMKSLRELSPDTQFIFVSEGGSIRTAIDAIHHGAFDYLAWPTENEHILRSVRQALEHQSLVAEDPSIRERLRKRADVDIFVGRSAAMKEVQRIIDQVAHTDVTVLIQGESGTGKELAARAIHEKSRRNGGPFVAVNCAALPETLIESELFGHVRGAFTGAISENRAASSWRGMEHCSSMRSAISHALARRICCACSRTEFPADWQQIDRSRECTHRGSDEQGVGERVHQGCLPRRSALPAQRHHHPPPATQGSS